MTYKLWCKKYEFVVDKNGQVIVKLDDGTYDIIWVKKGLVLQDVVCFSENGIKFIEEYCWLTDLITQVDKVERLQKAVDDALNVMLGLKSALEHANHQGTAELLSKDIERIKQLIKENQ